MLVGYNIDMFVENSLPIARFGTDEVWRAHPVDDRFEYSKNDLRDLVRICNEPAVYEILFYRKLSGKPYTTANAESLINWGKTGWKEQSRFAFLIRDMENTISASIDIKSNDLASSEIGYWATEHNPGIMTNAVLAICELAKDNGYKSLFGLVRRDNSKSLSVLQRAGFIMTDEQKREDRGGLVYCTYTLDLV